MSTNTTPQTSPMRLFFKRVLVALLSFQLTVQPVIAAAQTYKVEGGGGHAPNTSRPFVDGANNGVPVINISTPNGKGLSHNTYNHFNVSPKGLILNNSATNVSTDSAGWIDGNPNIRSGREARTILNEVVGATRSQLDGYMEAAGKRADIIVANPNGISCNGCGFINTDRGVLTTGIPRIGADGSLDHYRIIGGDIDIQALGLDGSGQQRIDLLAQSVKVYGKIKAQQQINIVTGNNEVAHMTGAVTQLADSEAGEAPEIGLDVSALGGMYANQISLIVTDKGAGVNMQGGELIAVDQLFLSAQGNISMAGTEVEVESGNATVTGADIAIGRESSLNKTSQWLVEGDLSIVGRGNTDISDGSLLTANGKVQLSGGNVSVTDNSVLTSKQGMTITAIATTPATTGGLTLSDSQLNSSADLVLNATGDATLSNSTLDVITAIDVTSGQQLRLQSSELSSLSSINLNGGNVNLSTGTTLDAEDNIDVKTLDNSGTVQLDDSALTANGSLSVVAGHVLANEGTSTGLQLNADQGITLQATHSAGQVNLNNAQLVSQGNVQVEGYDINLANSRINPNILGSGEVGLAAANQLTISQSSLSSDSLIQLTGRNIDLLDNSNVTSAAGETVDAIRSNARLQVEATGTVDITNTSVTGGKLADLLANSATVKGATINIDQGHLGSEGGLSLETTDSAGQLNLSNLELSSGTGVTLTSEGGLTLNNTSIDATTDVTARSVNTLTVDNSNISSLGDTDISAQRIELNAGTDIAAGKTIKIHTFDDTGTLSIDEASLVADEYLNLSAGDIEVGLNNTTGVAGLSTLIGKQGIDLNATNSAGALDIRWADLDSEGNVTATASRVNLQDTTLVTGGDIALTGGTDSTLDLSRTVLSSLGSTTVMGGEVSVSDDSTVAANQGIDFSSNNLTISDSFFSSEANASAVAAGIEQADQANISLQASQNLTLDGTTTLTASNNISLNASNQSLDGVTVAALQSLSLQGQGGNGSRANDISLKNSQLIAANDLLELVADTITANKSAAEGTAGQALAGGDIAIQTNRFTNNGTLFWAAHDFIVDRDGQGTRADLIRN